MRLLRRGVRGPDVEDWQIFLEKIRNRRDLGAQLPVIRVDGIYGRDTQRSTRAFQQRFRLKPDGIVGPRTRAVARELGFQDRELPDRKPTTQPTTPPGTGTLPPIGPPLPPPQPPPGPPPPAPGAGNTRLESHQRLRAEGWKRNGAVLAGLTAAKAVIQSVEDGDGDYIYDEYVIKVEAMPNAQTAESFLAEMANNLNGTVNDFGFNIINKFKRRRGGTPVVGEIIDIDILGPDDGSVILVETTPSRFIFQTIDSDETGAHPENGSREFGFERRGDLVIFYTRGVSRPGNIAIRIAGRIPQTQGWTRLMVGISTEIVRRGGTSSLSSFGSMRAERRN